VKNVLLAAASVSLWFFHPLMAHPECLYDASHDFVYNCTKEYPKDLPRFERDSTRPFPAKYFLGFPIASPIGIPACAIMTSNGISWAANAGYDVLTYKTVRSHPFNGHPLPNLFLLESPENPLKGSFDKMTTMPQGTVFEADRITMANSMGIPSLSLEWVLQDIAKARASLLPGQVLIVSIMGCPSDERTLEQDFAFLARAVVDAGAHIVEANLACPNLHSPLATYKDPKAIETITQAICEAVPNVPVVLKVGFYDSIEQMKEVFKAATAANAQGICGINSIASEVLDTAGNPAFGCTRRIAGVSGEGIRPLAYDFVVQARRIIDEERLQLALLATGGIMKPEQFDLFLKAGADVVLSATGAMWNPNLAIEWHASN
jgi:dihydroorotate dehydrogenase (NAD+) catalytic subunit